MNRRPLSVLLDLRPAFEGFSGIPHETRLMFPLLHGLDGIDVTGLINHPVLALARGLDRKRLIDSGLTPDRRINVLSRFVASTDPLTGRFAALRERTAMAVSFSWLQLLAMLRARIPLDHFDGAEFGDFLWRALFEMSLPPKELELCRTARYATLWAPWRSMHATALLPWPQRYPRVDTSDFDVLVAQTPWPGRVAPRTQLVVRYHDSIPVFLPHTVRHPQIHRFFHLSALRNNAQSAAFACVSEFSRTKLLQICPQVERRTFVVHDGVADAYFPEPARRDMVTDIIKSRIDVTTEPDLGPVRQRRSFYDSHVAPESFRFILMVATLEPRKNHAGLMAAWEELRMRSKRDVALVFVGSLGWGEARLLRAMQRWQLRGRLFHLSEVPAAEMRVLYSAADATVSPSVSEGFDLPAVEALRCGSVLAASDIPVHRELLGKAALYFDPYSTTSIHDALLRLLSEEDLQKQLRLAATQQAATFDTSTIGDQWQQVFDYCRANGGGALHKD